MSYAKIASASGFSDMNLIILKATAPDDLPLHEKYIQHLFKLLSISPSASLFDLGPRVAGVLHSSVSFFCTACFVLSLETALSGLNSYGHVPMPWFLSTLAISRMTPPRVRFPTPTLSYPTHAFWMKPLTVLLWIAPIWKTKIWSKMKKPWMKLFERKWRKWVKCLKCYRNCRAL